MRETRNRFRSLPAAALLIAAGCSGRAPEAIDFDVAPSELPRTRAEASGYAETSSHAEVVAFIDSLRALGAPIHVGTMGETTEGRALPYVIASRPLVTSPEEARRLGRPIAYVQGNIHGGEVEGKEALQMLLRDLVADPEPNVLDSLVLIAVPIYNADGNDAFGPAERNRGQQQGPARVGLRPNGQALDLNRDYVKAEAPETRASLEMFTRWRPDLFMDLHTTDGSYHGYALTYSPSLTPAAGESGAYTRDVLLPEIRRRMRERRGFETFDYGNFSNRFGPNLDPEAEGSGWYTYEHLPRYGTNYIGLRGAVSILSEAFSHDPFERRVESTYAFIDETLSLVAERAGELLAVTRADEPVVGRPVAIRAEMAEGPDTVGVLVEMLEEDPDSTPDEAGVARGIRRTGEFRAIRMPVYDRFAPVLERAAPRAYLLPPDADAVVALLEDHGVQVERLDAPARVQAEVFTIGSVAKPPRPFQGHYNTRVEGRWRAEPREVPAGWYRVPVDQHLGLVAVYLLEPESDDGIVAWCCTTGEESWQRSFIPDAIRAGAEYPIVRVP